MDLDAYSAAHGAEWDRLATLASLRTLDGAGADELIDGYQAGASQLSAMKTTVGESIQGDRLSLILSRARLRFTGAGTDPLRQLTIFFGAQLPAALYRVRWVTLVIAGLTALVATVYGVWVASDPAVFASLGPEDQLRQLANQQFVQYYSDASLGGKSAEVWTHNALIAAMLIGFGIIGLYVPVGLLENAKNVGITGGVMAHYGKLGDFFLYIAPHGQLELYTVFTAGAAGLLIFWSWVAPGPRTRLQALAEDGRAFFSLVAGCAIFLLMSGLIEGIVTRQPWPWPIKIGIGTLALAIVLVYQWVVGRRAFRAGQTGDLDEADAGARQIISA